MEAKGSFEDTDMELEQPARDAMDLQSDERMDALLIKNREGVPDHIHYVSYTAVICAKTTETQKSQQKLKGVVFLGDFLTAH